MMTFTTSQCGDAPQTEMQGLAQLTKDAVAGDAEAQYHLGVMYGDGDGVAQDAAEAMKWYRLAADQGVADAQRVLEDMYRKGDGADQDYTETVTWYRLAAEQGDSFAQASLGVHYYRGDGVVEDFVQAYKWSNLATAQGADEARQFRDLLAARMSKEQIAEGQKLSTDFRVTKSDTRR